MPSLPIALPLAAFGPLDWLVVAGYFVLAGAAGLLLGRAKPRRGAPQDRPPDDASATAAANDYFLGSRAIPTWTVAVSIVASSLSAATFVGVPDQAYKGDVTYLAHSLGGILAALLVAFTFVPVLYRAGTLTIYGFLARRYGEGARVAVSATFVFGRFLASGSRLFMAAIPLSLLMFGPGERETWQYLLCIALVGGVVTFYTVFGGVRAVVWLDVLQLAVVVAAALLTVGLLLHRIPLSLPELYHLLSTTTPTPKTRLVDLSADPAKPFTVWAAAFGASFLWVAALGVDHDLAQRFLVAKSPARGALSVIASQFISVAVISLFLLIGLLLYVFYDRPDVMGVTHAPPADRLSMYPWFLAMELPTLLSGLCIAGFFAIAQGSMDSAVNALAASIVADVYHPLRRRLSDAEPPPISEGTSKLVVAAVGGVMCAFAAVCAITYDPKSNTLLNFALGVMTFAFSGMLGVFLCALFTRRGSTASVVAALIAGFVTVALLQDNILAAWTQPLLGHKLKLAWPWWMTIGTTVSFLVSLVGNRRTHDEKPVKG